MRYENPPGTPKPVGQYTNVAVLPAGADTVYVAGQLPVGEGGAIEGDDFAAQAELVFDRLAETLRGSGSSMSEIATLRVFLVDEGDFAGLREARQRAFAKHGVTEPPPATTVIVKGLFGGALIELDAIAAAQARPS